MFIYNRLSDIGIPDKGEDVEPYMERMGSGTGKREFLGKLIVRALQKDTAMGILEMFALANILQCDIHAFFPDKVDPQYRLLMHRVCQPKELTSRHACYMMFTVSDPERQSGYVNHFVPIVKGGTIFKPITDPNKIRKPAKFEGKSIAAELLNTLHQREDSEAADVASCYQDDNSAMDISARNVQCCVCGTVHMQIFDSLCPKCNPDEGQFPIAAQQETSPEIKCRDCEKVYFQNQGETCPYCADNGIINMPPSPQASMKKGKIAAKTQCNVCHKLFYEQKDNDNECPFCLDKRQSSGANCLTCTKFELQLEVGESCKTCKQMLNTTANFFAKPGKEVESVVTQTKQAKPEEVEEIVSTQAKQAKPEEVEESVPTQPKKDVLPTQDKALVVAPVAETDVTLIQPQPMDTSPVGRLCAKCRQDNDRKEGLMCSKCHAHREEFVRKTRVGTACAACGQPNNRTLIRKLCGRCDSTCCHQCGLIKIASDGYGFWCKHCKAEKEEESRIMKELMWQSMTPVPDTEMMWQRSSQTDNAKPKEMTPPLDSDITNPDRAITPTDVDFDFEAAKPNVTGEYNFCYTLNNNLFYYTFKFA